MNISEFLDMASSFIGKLRSRKAQFFIITVVLVAGSLSITLNVLEDYQNIDYNQVTSSVAPSQFRSMQKSLESAWYSEGWRYRREIELSLHPGVEFDSFPVAVDVNTSRLIEEGKMRSGCEDLRVGRDGRQIPIQIEPGSCNRGNTTVWFLYSSGSSHHLYYGNSNIEAPVYDTELEWNPRKEVLENELVEMRAGSSEDGKGFIELRRKGSRNLVREGTVLFKGGSSEKPEVVEEGPVYVTVGFDQDHRYTLFASSSFVRRDNQVNISADSTDGMVWYASNSSVLSHWEAGNSSNQVEVGPDKVWSGTLSGGDQPYIAALRPEMESLALTVDTNSLNKSVDRYRAEGSGGELYLGLGSSEGDGVLEAPYIDFVLGRNGVSRSDISLHSRPPEAEVRSEETGAFDLSNSWSNRRKISIRENNGTSLSNYPVESSINTGEMNVREDCSDLVVVEDGAVRPHILGSQCDSLSFKQPRDFTARFAIDRGIGSNVNGSREVFTGSIKNGFEWVSGRFGFGLSLKRDGKVVVEDNPRLELEGSSFGISLWIKGDFGGQEFGQVGLVEYPEDTPSLVLVNRSGNVLLEGRFRNTTGGVNTVRGTTDLSSLDPGWHHVGMVFDSRGNMSVFLDGEPDGSGKIKGDMAIEQDLISLGDGFEGEVDEFKIYKRMLSNDEVRDQYVSTTDIRFLTNLSAGDVESDIAVFGGSHAGLRADSTSSFEARRESYNLSIEPSVVSISQVDSYRSIASGMEQRFENAEGLGSSTEIEVEDGCSTVSFDNGLFNIERRVC
ncbi:MAG: LamG-like jellyroll fold domain-containing protein [Candidatus Nanohaloarchaea archaeon]|nr:LamG-like jellyroll fold domain-containing protein [Candidatus Nanohaloarchaea archaeon]